MDVTFGFSAGRRGGSQGHALGTEQVGKGGVGRQGGAEALPAQRCQLGAGRCVKESAMAFNAGALLAEVDGRGLFGGHRRF